MPNRFVSTIVKHPVWLLHSMYQNCIREFSEDKSCVEESFRCCKYTQTWITQLFHSESEYTIVTSSCDGRKFKSTIFFIFRMQQFVWSILTANYTMLESYFECLWTTLSLVNPAVKIPTICQLYTTCAAIISLNNNECKLMKVIQNYNNKNISYAL